MKKSQHIIGIDGSRAFLSRRTGIEEYSYQVIRHLRDELSDARVIVYVRADQEVDFDLPENWRVKKLWAPRFWTQIRLSLEMLFHRPDVLLVPAHTVPLIHPNNTVVVVHGLEYEFCPKAYSRWSRWSMRAAIRFSCRVSKTVICVSENTKRDVMRLYGTPEEKMAVVYEGYSRSSATDIGQGLTESSHCLAKFDGQDFMDGEVCAKDGQEFFKPTCGTPHSAEKLLGRPLPSSYFLFIGRLEERKNIVRFIEAFEIFKEKHDTSHKLILAGKPGYGYGDIRARIDASACKNDIVETGYISEEEKWMLLKRADVFVFATLYEGFGIPVLEAQSVGVPVITSNYSSLPEVAGDGALLVDPKDTMALAEALWRLISDKVFKSDIIRKGAENVKRFSWAKCAREIAVLLKEGK